MNVSKFEMYHGERYSQDVNENCQALSTPQQMVSSILRPPLQEKIYTHIELKSSWTGTYGPSDYATE
jgi:hypothetical protein